MLGLPTTRALVERLQVDGSLRRICGWERRAEVPSEATFSRAFGEFANDGLPERMHEALVKRAFGDRIVGVVARDATEIEAREKPGYWGRFPGSLFLTYVGAGRIRLARGGIFGPGTPRRSPMKS